MQKENCKSNMNNIPPKLRKQLAADPYYQKCARAGLHDHECGGRVTWEHALTFQGKQVQARYAILPICARGHEVDGYQDGGDLNKEVHLWIALNRATDEELASISRAYRYIEKRDRLNAIYGVYHEDKAPTPPRPVPVWFWSGALPVTY